MPKFDCGEDSCQTGFEYDLTEGETTEGEMTEVEEGILNQVVSKMKDLKDLTEGDGDFGDWTSLLREKVDQKFEKMT